MQSEFSFCYTEGKPQTLVMLKDVKTMPKLLFATPEENVFVWVGRKDDGNITKTRDQVERELGQCIYHYATVQQTMEQLKKDRPQFVILIAMIQLFQSWKLLSSLNKVKALYFYSDSNDYEHLMRPLWYQKMGNQQNAADQSYTDEDQTQIEQPPQIVEQQIIANEWESYVYTETNCLVEKLREHKGMTANHLKVLPNFIFMAKQISVSHQLVRTMHSMLNQEIDEQTKIQINKRFEDLLQQISKIDSRIRQEEQQKKKFFKFICSSSHPIKQIISWYTNETFLYRFVNNLLRSHRHPAEVFYVQPYIKLLFNTIKQLYMEQSKERSGWSFVCYRGGNMEQKQFELFQQYKGETVQNLGFLSTSLNKQTAERFLKKGNLFIEIGVKESRAGISEFGFANIQDFSKFYNEEEILFNPLNTFRIIQAQQKEGQYFLMLNYLLLDDNKNTKMLSQNQNYHWAHIAKLQKQQKYLNICQGNSLTNQYYNLQGADTYWDKYIEIVDENLKNKIGNKNFMQLKRAFGEFNKSNHKKMNPTFGQDVYQNLDILNQLFGDQNQIVQKYKNSKRNHQIKYSSNSHILSKQERSMLFLLPEYKFLSKVNFDRLQIMGQKKYLINKTLNLNNYGEKDIQATIMEIGKQFGEKIKKIKLEQNRITSLKENIFQKYKNLQELDLRFNEIQELKKPLLNLHNLTTLNLGDNKIGDDGAKGLELGNLNNLTTLNLGDNKIGDDGAKGLALGNLNNLTTLNLRFNQIGDDGAKGLALGNLNNLTTLNLWRNQIGDDGAKGLELGNLNNLTTLNLGDNKIGDDGAKGLALGNLNNLTTLNLGDNKIGDDGAKGLALGNLNNLTTLNLRFNQIGDDGAKGLALGNLNNLTTLNLRFNQIGDDGAKGLALGNLNNLTTLNLRGNKIGDDGAKGLALGNLNNLTTLNLGDNKIGDDGAKGLALGNLNNLTTLNLGDNKIGDDGAKGLALGNLNNLTTLYLCQNQIGDDGAKGLALGNLNNLTTLYLCQNQIGDDGAKGLALGNLNNLTTLNLQGNKIGLTTLNLDSNQIGDDGAKGLALVNLHNLTTLNLESNQLQNSSLIKDFFLIKYKGTLTFQI